MVIFTDYFYKLKQCAEQNGGIITAKSAEACGISRAMLCKLNKAEVITRITKGQYVLYSELQDELFSLSLRSDNIIFSHETALWLHGISDRTPFEHSVTVPTGKNPSLSIRENCRVYSIKPEYFNLGKILLTTQHGNSVPVYDLERTVCDTVRSRNKMSSETVNAALKAYAVRKDKNLNLLYTYSQKLGIETVIRRYAEVLL